MDGQTGFIVRNRNNHAGLDRGEALLFVYLVISFSSCLLHFLDSQGSLGAAGKLVGDAYHDQDNYLWSITTPGGA